MLFHFQLSPVADIAPWTTPSRENEKSLHWFGLTDGRYWLDVGGGELFRYSEAVVAHWARAYPGAGPEPHVEYYVVRLWEDILEMLPAVLEPVPDDLARLVRTGGVWGSWAGWRAWREAAYTLTDGAGEEAGELFHRATAWWGERRLDTAYLAASPGIWMWREGDRVHVQWDNRDILVDGIPAWATQWGTTSLMEEDFIGEVCSFDKRLIGAMAERVDAVRHDWPHPGVRLDWVGLRQEHRTRAAACAHALTRPPLQTDWDDVRAALAEVERRLVGATP